ncbi:MAG: aminotransferase class V-fold PLP-dependent enzyme [Chloroflexi bacterium]|nr:aminotransferase class V-fold PLP-dependent enzyme [Chloroflexota bacterium]
MMSLVPKSDFIGVEDVAHLCTGGESPFLKSNADALLRFALEKGRGMPGRANLYAVYRRAKERAAELLGCEAGDVAFLSNASEGINALALAVDWRPGDNVVVEDIEYPSDVYPWARRGVEVRTVPTRHWDVSLDDLADAIDARTRVLAISHVSYLTGRRYGLEELSALARRSGALLSVDVSHSLGAVPVFAPLCDFVFSACYKWQLATHGVGICYWNRSRWPNLQPAQVGWHSVTGRHGPGDRAGYELRADAGRLEIGNPSFVSLYVLDNALGYLLNVGVDRIERHVLDLGGRLRAGLVELGFEVMTPELPESRAGNICIATGESARLAGGLAERGILVWEGEGRIRISVHLYNDERDVDRCLAALRELK